VDLIVSPTTVALNPQQGAAVPALKAGDIIEAKVLELLGQIAKLGIGSSILEVQTQVALTPGTTVRLAVKSTPDGIRLTLLGTTGNAGGASVTPGATAAPQPSAEEIAGNVANPATITGSAAGTTAGQAAPVAIGAALADLQLQPQPQPQAPNVAAAAAVAVAVQNSAARQGGLGPLLADAGIAVNVPALPEPVRQAAERLLALQPTLDHTITADTLKQALGSSGLLLEAHLAAAAGGGAAEVLPNDLKAAMMVLRDALKTWFAGDLPIAGDTGSSAAEAGAPGLRGAPSMGSGGATTDAGPRSSATAPPPPYRGAPTSAQPAAVPSITSDTAPRDIGRVLIGETDAAIARQTLMQAASLPDHLNPNARNDPSGPRWLFEVPFATPQGTSVAQFEIARDGRNAPADATKPAWRARFSLDLEPIGPVHAHIALVGSRAAVTLWAERPETSAKLRDNAPQLADALRQAELDSGDVLVRAGAPPRPRQEVSSGHFLDRAS
jgi:hypothetical protein